MNQACTRARVTQPSPHIFLHICILYFSTKLDKGGGVVQHSESFADVIYGWSVTLFLAVSAA